MKVFTCTKFTGHWPVGSAAVVIAETAAEAAEDLNHKLRTQYSLIGDAKAEDMLPFPANEMESIRVLCDGNY